MADEERISTFNESRLKEYFDTRVKKPRRWWFKAIEEVAEGVSLEVGPVKVGKFKEVIRNLTVGNRYRYAAWNWLRPHSPCLTLADMRRIQEAAALDHLDSSAFLPGLRDHCNELLREHTPALALWIPRRLALLEYRLKPPVETLADSADTAVGLRHGVLQAVNYLWQDLDYALEIAEECSASALDAAARVTRHVLGRSDCRVSANLMVPVRQGQNGPSFAPDEALAVTARAATATRVWKECPPSASGRCLLVVAETQGAEHLGFWAPDTQGDHRRYLPGAPFAFREMAGSAVFVDDLPPLVGFPKKLEAAWHAYMEGDFREKMFVSLPFRAPVGKGKSDVVAVLNVNANPPDEDGWRRGYHREWLEIAQERVAPFVEVAYRAHQVKMLALAAAGRSRMPELDTGYGAWDSLPGGGAVRALPGGRE